MTELRQTGDAPIIVGAGLAGLMTALALAPQPVVVMSKAPLGVESSSAWAQGGIAVALADDDSVGLHLDDTLAAGDGLCDAEIAKKILAAGPAAIEALLRLGVPFDRDPAGRILLGLEAAHSRRRIVHAGGDSSGHAIVKALVARVRETPSITVIEGVAARRLIVADNRIAGVLGNTTCGPVLFASDRVVIASGGVSSLFLQGTNPAGSFGQGLALAARAGAALADLEFIQFHPTALDAGGYPLKLISETVRGEGAILVDETGHRFMADEPGAELAPRDVVARAVWRQMQAGHKIFLDARQNPKLDFAKRFPAITGFCHAAGIDPARQPIPIRPAAHYHMGGIAVDAEGRTSVEGLWACGEAACTGLHGANRLASNSLLEAAVCGQWTAASLAGTPGHARGVEVKDIKLSASDPAPVRPILTQGAGVLRDRDGLKKAASALYGLATSDQPASDPALVGLMIVISALRREESRGAHTRTDFPAHETTWIKRPHLTLDEALATARASVPELAA
jgi:L-aspartate oxidase